MRQNDRAERVADGERRRLVDRLEYGVHEEVHRGARRCWRVAVTRQVDRDRPIATLCECGTDLVVLRGAAEHAVDEEGDAIAGAPRHGVQSHQSRVLAVMRRWPRAWEAGWISGLPRIWEGARMAVSWAAYQSGSSVLARRRVWVSSMASRRPMERGIQQAASARGASIRTSMGYFQPRARCSSTAASGSRSGGGVKSWVRGSTLVTLSTR